MDMNVVQVLPAAAGAPPDPEIVRRVRAGETALFELLMRRHNQRVYRVARAVLRDEGDVEEVMQQAYVNAYTHLHQFEERAQFSTWLTRITVNEALAQRRASRRRTPMTGRHGEQDDSEESMETLRTPDADPERQAYSRELSDLLEEAVDNLPDTYRMVFMLRDVEGMSTRETSEGLGLGEEAVKTRLHRARALIRRSITERVGVAAAGSFQFHASRCDRVVAGVMARI
jgi:RNA polymerase sigma-70 factor (ECF subfamily)